MIIFENLDWLVDREGMHRKETPPDYNIFYDRIRDVRDTKDGPCFDWPLHLAEKSDVDVQLLCDAFERAMHYHVKQIGEPVHQKMLTRSREHALAIERRRRFR